VKDVDKYDAVSLAFEEYQRRTFGTPQQVASTPPRSKNNHNSNYGRPPRPPSNPNVRKKLKT